MAVKFFTSLAFVFGSVLMLGLILPGSWAVERSLEMPASPEAVFPYVNEVELWGTWTPWPDSEASFFGPDAGVGAGRRWNDPEFGDGVFTIVESVENQRVAYRVEVEGGSMITEGSIVLESSGAGTHVVWREVGDFGWNPILGFVARTMDRLQGRELERGLERLRSVSGGAEG